GRSREPYPSGASPRPAVSRIIRLTWRDDKSLLGREKLGLLGGRRRSSAAASPGPTRHTRSGVVVRLSLRRQLVAVRRGRHFEGVDDSGQEPIVVGGRRQLDQPLHVVSLLERIERGLIDTVLLDQLLGVSHDVPLCGRKLCGVSLRTDKALRR